MMASRLPVGSIGFEVGEPFDAEVKCVHRLHEMQIDTEAGSYIVNIPKNTSFKKWDREPMRARLMLTETNQYVILTLDKIYGDDNE